MKYKNRLKLIAVLLCSFTTTVSAWTSRAHVPGELVVGLQTSLPAVGGQLSLLGYPLLPSDLADGYVLLDVGTGRPLAAIAHELMKLPMVRYAEPNWRRYPQIYSPSDTRFREQWALKNTGQPYRNLEPSWDPPGPPIPGADLNLTRYWDADNDGRPDRAGSGVVKVAVLDDGFVLNHEDLAGLFVNGRDTGEIDNDPSMPAQATESHGTPVANAIAGVSNDGRGLAGPNWNVQLLAIKVATDEGEYESSAIAAGVDFAIAQGAKIINMSFGGPGFSQTELEAFQRARDAGILLVTSASNDSYNDDIAQLNYPPMYELDNLLNVAASNRSDGLASFSNYGSWSSDLAAPGGEVLLANGPETNARSYIDGTSFAAPYAAGIAALLMDVYPNAGYREIMARLIESGRDLGETDALRLGTRSGRVDALNAVSLLPSPALTIAGYRVDDANSRFDRGETTTLVVRIENFGLDASNVVARLLPFGDGDGDLLVPASAPVSVGFIASGSVAEARFDVTVDARSNQHGTAELKLILDADGGAYSRERGLLLEFGELEVGSNIRMPFPDSRHDLQHHWVVSVGTLPAGMNAVELTLESDRLMALFGQVGRASRYGGLRVGGSDYPEFGMEFDAWLEDDDGANPFDLEFTGVDVDEESRRINPRDGKKAVIEVPVASGDAINLALIDLAIDSERQRSYTLSSRYIALEEGDGNGPAVTATPTPTTAPSVTPLPTTMPSTAPTPTVVATATPAPTATPTVTPTESGTQPRQSKKASGATNPFWLLVLAAGLNHSRRARRLAGQSRVGGCNP